MSTTVSYKGNTIATLSNETKTLTTAGTWVEGNIEIVDTKDNPILQSKTATPTESVQTITPDTGYDGLSSVEVGAISSSYVGSGIDQNDSDDLTVSGATVTAPAGYYAESASKSVASGTAGTPTATKGTVSNHSISVIPSVTNTTGYITGGTITGTAVTVSASELVSGNKEITSNGTNIDVVGYSTVSVAVPSSSTAIITDTADVAGGTIRTITTTDEVYLQTKTITPTSSQQIVLPDTGYDGFSSVIVGASSGGGDSAQTKTGTFTGDGTVTAQIPCDFAPDFIYVYGDLSGDVSLRGVVSLTFIKDTAIFHTADTSSSALTNGAYIIINGDVSEYTYSSSYTHATYANGVLAIDCVQNTSACRFASGISYSYKLVKWT